MSYLRHYGIDGMKWGVRRYQNEDGSLTLEGKARYNQQKNAYKAYADQAAKEVSSNDNKRARAAYNEVAHMPKYQTEYDPEMYGLKDDFEKDFSKVYSKMTYDEIVQNKNWKSAQTFLHLFVDISSDEVVKENEAFINDLKEKFSDN